MSTLLDVSTWADGAPPERALIAWFAAASPEELNAILRRVITAAIVVVAPEPTKSLLLALNAKPVGPRPLVDEEWSFPGGEALVEAMDAAEASAGMHRVPLRSFGHALAVFENAITAVLEHEHSAGREPNARDVWLMLLRAGKSETPSG